MPKNKNLIGSFRRLDIMSREINLTYQGQRTFKTNQGATLSLCTMVGILMFATYRLMDVVNHGEADYQVQRQFSELNSDFEFNAGLVGFKYAFGF